MARNNELATNITARINVIEAVPNIDINYGPYNSVHEAFQTLNECGAIAIGMTVGVITNDSIQEYWFKSGVTETDLVEKLATQGTTDYDDLSNKPKIGDKTLDSSTTLEQIGAASETDLTNHTNNKKIHVPMTYGGTTTAIDGFKIEGEKMTITVGNTEYSFRLTAWQDLADYYVLYGIAQSTNIQSTHFQVEINQTFENWEDVSGGDLMTLAQNQTEHNGYMFNNTTTTSTVTHGQELVCNYVNSVPANSTYNTIFVLYRTSSIDFVYLVGDLQDDVWFDNQTDDSNTYMTKPDGVSINSATYNLKAFYTSQGIGGNKVVIKFK